MQIFCLVVYEWVFLVLICAYQGRNRLFDGMGDFLRMNLLSIALLLYFCNSYIFTQRIETADKKTGLRIIVPKSMEIFDAETEPYVQSTLLGFLLICLAVELGYLASVIAKVGAEYWREFRG